MWIRLLVARVTELERLLEVVANTNPVIAPKGESPLVRLYKETSFESRRGEILTKIVRYKKS